MKRHSDLISADVSKKKTDQIMTEFMTNIQEHEPDWKENIAENENDKNVEISDEDDQFDVSSDKKFEKKNEEKK